MSTSVGTGTFISALSSGAILTHHNQNQNKTTERSSEAAIPLYAEGRCLAVALKSMNYKSLIVVVVVVVVESVLLVQLHGDISD